MKRILIIKIGAIGDVIMALPTIAEIRKQHPASHITWICGEIVEPILLLIPDINEVISVNENQLFHKGKWKTLKELLRVHKRVFFKKFDLILNFHSDYRYRSIDFPLMASKKLYLARDSKRPALIPGRSRAFEHIRLFLQSDDNFEGALQFPPDAFNTVQPKMDHKRILSNGKKNVIIAPGGAKNTLNEQSLRRWPIENYVQMSEYLLKSDYNVILLGASSDAWLSPYFQKLEVVNMVGLLSLTEVIALMRCVEFVVTHDSGPFHLSVIAQKPYVVGLFGPTNPSEFTYSRNFDKIEYVWGGADLLCSPCYYGKYFSFQCKNNICMQHIQPQLVIDIINKFADKK